MLQECSQWTALPGITMKKWFSSLMSRLLLLGSHGSFAAFLPKCLVAGQDAGCLTEEGAKLLDVTGRLKAGIPMCPPEGDAGTGMVATNSVAKRTGNVSAGTSVFASIVLEKELSALYSEIDMVMTPSGHPVAMAHSNNCTSDLNAWVNIFREFAEAMGMEADMNKLNLYNKALREMWTAADFILLLFLR